MEAEDFMAVPSGFYGDADGTRRRWQVARRRQHESLAAVQWRDERRVRVFETHIVCLCVVSLSGV